MVLALTLACLLLQAAPSAPRIASIPHAKGIARDESFTSTALGRTMMYRVLLPRGYMTSRVRYRTLYLLHGLAGHYTDWSTRSDLASLAGSLPLIIVMPEGENAWYTNAANSGPRFEDYIADDLIKDVESKYRVMQSRYGRAIAGLSMGGYGAIKIALRHPASFAAAGSFSGAFVAVDPSYDDHMKGYTDELYRIFGPAGSDTRTANDVLAIAQTIPVAGAPALYLGCGTRDDLYLPRNRDLAVVLQHRGFAYEFHETPGAHAWDYWNRSLAAFLPWVMNVFREAQ